jgi:hypothetical protein
MAKTHINPLKYIPKTRLFLLLAIYMTIPTILTPIPRHADHLGSLPSRGSFSASKELVCKSTVSPFSSWTNLEFDPVGTVYEPVEDGVGDGALPDDLVPAGHGQL